MRTSRPLWVVVGLAVVIATALHVLVVALTQSGVLPGSIRGLSFVLVVAGVVAVLVTEALCGRSRALEGWIEWPAIGLGYALLSMTFFLPKTGRWGTGILGGTDALQTLWGAWWIQKAVTSGLPMYFTDLVWAPIGAPLVYHFLTPIQSTLIILLKPILGEAGAFNGVLFLALPLAGLGAYALVRTLGAPRLASFIGGLAFAWSPFLTSKFEWINLAYCGSLALFAVALVRAFPLDGGATANRQTQAGLALATLLVIFSGSVNAVFAANLGLARLVACAISQRALWRTVRQFVRACIPIAIALLPYFTIIVYSSVNYDVSVSRSSEFSFVPELLNYMLPFVRSSIHAAWSQALFVPLPHEFTKADLACYLGVLVLPLAIAGWCLGRGRPEARFWTGVFVFFLILSFGPRFLMFREPVQLFGRSIPLPFAMWQHLPVVGFVAQSGRYLVLSYLAMAVGIGLLGAHLRDRLRPRRFGIATIAIGAMIALDFAFVVSFSPLPAVPVLAPDPGRVMDVRIYRGQTMYYQTKHERPIVGGYLSRPTRDAQRLYRQSPCIAWLMYNAPSTACDTFSLRRALAEFEVTDVFLDPGDKRGQALAARGFSASYRDESVEVWSIPPAWQGDRHTGHDTVH